ncbi:MAG: acyl-ACP--UDP-N-acetylglucosamine O-acyltransferase [Verrucomicrobiales bacterium]|nr:acyl-ACP--UDP-N-acetylglucosamine O-acyltransferase [Verrucomicrobiales bacterium]
MPQTIHPTAIISPTAKLGDNVEIGPYCVVFDGVVLGDGCWLQNHVTLCGPSKIGRNNRFHSYCSIGQQSQDLKYTGEPTHLEIGDDNVFREFCTVNRGTLPGTLTKIGSRGAFLSYVHIAHDCLVGDDVIFSNNGTLAGHVVVEDHAVLGGFSAVHQFCRIGRHSITGGCTKIVQDVAPYTLVDGNPAKCRGINAVGLQRRGFSDETLRALKEAYKVIYLRHKNRSQAVAELEAGAADPHVAHLARFFRDSQRGVT